MRISNFFYLVKQGFRSVGKNKAMSFSCIGVLVACMLLIGAAVLFSVSINNIAGEMQRQTDIVAYLEDNTTGADVSRVNKALSEIKNISETKFSSKEDVLADMKLKLGRYGAFFDGLESKENPFPGTYVLRLEDPALTEETVGLVEAIPGILEVKASVEVARLLGEIKQTAFYAGSVIVLILVVVSLVIITSTIKLTILSRRREINIMKYVGATDAFIRLPFIIEGMVIGLIAAVLAFIMLGLGYTYLMQWAAQNYGQMFSLLFSNAVTFTEISLELFAGFAGLGVIIGMLSSGVFVRKHLRV